MGGKGAMPPKMPNIVQHDTEKNTILVCTAMKMPPMASNYAFHFHLAFNFRLCTLKMLQLLGDCVPQAPCWGFAPGPHC